MDLEKRNPFEYDKANSLAPEQIKEYFIDDHNFSRFLPTGKNIILKGSRGTGKTMAMLYFSFSTIYNYSISKGDNVDFSRIGIHIPCKNPIFQKQEFILPSIDDFKANIIAEHFLSLNIVYEISKVLKVVNPKLIDYDNVKSFKSKLDYLLGIELPEINNVFEGLMMFSQKQSINTQLFITERNFDSFYSNSFSFNSLVIPILNSLQDFPFLVNSHFMFMFDDIQDLNDIQKRVINSWIAFRDNKYFSFKLATTELKPLLITSSGGTILENHDFIAIDMIEKFHSKGKEFYKLARKIIKKRLELFDINVEIDEFIPTSSSFTQGLIDSRIIANQKAIEKFPYPEGSQISDYVAKHSRVEYFRNRHPNANRHPYSGIETIIDISTGVIRHLLIPLYWMYDKELSNQSSIDKPPIQIPVSTQTEIIIRESDNYWERLKNIHYEIGICSKSQSNYLYNFFDNLMILYRERLLDETISEPRAISFIITSQDSESKKKTEPLIDIAIKANFLYKRLGTSKTPGKQDVYYTPNRYLLPTRGLDAHGQYARVSLKAYDFINAAYNNIKIPKINNIDDGQKRITFEE